MADGIRLRAGATYGLATTGIAGPSGGTPEKPVGLTFLGLSWDGGALVKRRVFVGDRDQIRQRASHGVLWLLYDHLEG
jgi:nicotinamide mononucleotide (NMN) deamidase PncC